MAYFTGVVPIVGLICTNLFVRFLSYGHVFVFSCDFAALGILQDAQGDQQKLIERGFGKLIVVGIWSKGGALKSTVAEHFCVEFILKG